MFEERWILLKRICLIHSPFHLHRRDKLSEVKTSTHFYFVLFLYNIFMNTKLTYFYYSLVNILSSYTTILFVLWWQNGKPVFFIIYQYLSMFYFSVLNNLKNVKNHLNKSVYIHFLKYIIQVHRGLRMYIQKRTFTSYFCNEKRYFIHATISRK